MWSISFWEAGAAGGVTTPKPHLQKECASTPRPQLPAIFSSILLSCCSRTWLAGNSICSVALFKSKSEYSRLKCSFCPLVCPCSVASQCCWLLFSSVIEDLTRQKCRRFCLEIVYRISVGGSASQIVMDIYGDSWGEIFFKFWPVFGLSQVRQPNAKYREIYSSQQ